MSDETFEGDEGFKNLRKAYDELKAERKALADKVSQFEGEKRTQSLTEILKAKGLKESVAAHYSGEVSEDAVVKWATDLGLPVEGSSAENDGNSDAARRAAAAAGGMTQGGSQRQESTPGATVLGDPEEILFKLNNLSYADLVKEGLMPPDPNAV